MTARSSAWWWPTHSRPRARRPTRSKIDYRRRKAERELRLARRRPRSQRSRKQDCRTPATPKRRSTTPRSSSRPPTARRPQHHNPIELFTTTAVWNNDELTIYEPSQFMYGLKNNAAQKLGIEPDKVHAVSHFVGGAFGSKAQLTPRTGLVALAAKKLNRPVKLVATRDQGFTIATYRAETRHSIKIGARAERQDHQLPARRLGSHVAARRLFGRRRRGQRAALRLRRGQDRRHAGARRPQHAGLHALAAGRALHLRAGKRDGRAGGEAQHGSGRAAPRQRFDEGRDRQGMVEPLADEMLRPGGAALRLVEAQRPSPARCATATG